MRKLLVSGNLTSDPKIEFIGENKIPLCKFGLASNERKLVKGEWVKDTRFYDVAVWGANANFVSKFTEKGTLVSVMGNSFLETWEKKDGGQGSKEVIDKAEVEILTGRKDQSAPASEASSDDSGEEEESEEMF